MVQHVNRKRAVLVFIIVFMLLGQFLIPNIALAQERKIQEKQFRNATVMNENLFGALNRGVFLDDEEQNKVIGQIAQLLYMHIDNAKICDYGGVYSIENQETLILIGHGKNGIINSELQMEVEELSNGKSLVILGFCSSNEYKYTLDTSVEVITFEKLVLITTVIFTIQKQLNIDRQLIIDGLCNILKFNAIMLEIIYTYTILKDYSFAKKVLKSNKLQLNSDSLLFYLPLDPNDPIIGLDPGAGGGSGGGTIADDPRILMFYDSVFIKETVIYQTTYGNEIVEYTRPDDVLYFPISRPFDQNYTIPVYLPDTFNFHLIWFHYTPIEVQKMKDDSTWAKIITLAIIAAIIAIITAIFLLLGEPLIGLFYALGLAICAYIFAEMYDDEMDFIEEIETERHDGWAVFRYNFVNQRVDYTSGERFWYNWESNPNSENGWIYTGQLE